MAAAGQLIVVADTPTLIFSVVDDVTYQTEGYTPAANPNIFKAADANAPLPLLLIFATSGTVYLGGSAVAASGSGPPYLRDAPGVAITGATLPSLAYNCVGGDSLYGITASSTFAIQLFALRQ
jgi:hypothetical protein